MIDRQQIFDYQNQFDVNRTTGPHDLVRYESYPMTWKESLKLTAESGWYNLKISCSYVSYGRIMNETAIWNQKFRMNLYQYDWITIACVSETILYKTKLWEVKVQSWQKKNSKISQTSQLSDVK